MAKRTGVGLGAIRTILRKLQENGYLKSSGYGSSLTNRGKQLYANLKELIPKIVSLRNSSLTVGKEQVAILVRANAAKVKEGIEQRDAAIRTGASGATTYVIRESKFTVPKGSNDCEADFPSKIWKTLRDQLQPTEGDTIIVCGSDDPLLSKIGALNAALTIF